MAAELTYDHQAIFVTDLGASARFYGEVLRLPEIENKSGRPTIRWFSGGRGVQLHLISGEGARPSLRKEIHFALSTPDLDEFITHLEKRRVLWGDWPGTAGKIHFRADGVRQIYFQDPDGYWVEVNDGAPHDGGAT